MEKLAMIFSRFAEVEAKESSPLYAYWSKRIATDFELLNLVSTIPVSQPKPNLFFASIQYLALLKQHDLKKYFLAPYSNTDFFEDSYNELKAFSKVYETELKVCFNTKLVQTNEVNCSAYLYPIFSEIEEQQQKPLTLLEIGTSAGLLLNLDHYCYEISEDTNKQLFGEFESAVKIEAKNDGKTLANTRAISINNRIGIDLNIVDLQNDDDYLWMQALIWPEQQKRKQLLEKVRAINKNVPKILLEGDFLELIPSIVENNEVTSQLVIFHTHVANQFSKELKLMLLQMLVKLSFIQPIFHVYNNMYDGNLHVDYMTNGKTDILKVLKNVDGHGKYFTWN